MEVFPGGSGAHRGIFQRLANPHPHAARSPAGAGALCPVAPTSLCPSEHTSLEKGWELQTKDSGGWN